MSKQKNSLKLIISGALTVIISVLIVVAIARATGSGYGYLTPATGTSTPTGYTLNDIYNRITSSTVNSLATSTASSHLLTAPVSTSTDALHTLVDIWNKIPTIHAGNLLSSTTYLGVTGNIAIRGAQKINPGTASTTILAGYHNGLGYCNGDANLVAGNIRSGYTIFGVPGSFTGGGGTFTYGSSSPAGVLTSPAAPATGGTFVASNLTNSLIATGTAWGVSQVGTLLGHMFNGTCSNSAYCPLGTEFPGGSQANGGVDDYNNAGSVPSGRYAISWTKCTGGTGGNSYCGTNDSFAAYKDPTTGLIWSNPCASTGCTSYSTSSPAFYRWDQYGTSNNYNATSSASSTAPQLCSNNLTLSPNNKSYHGGGWSLPNQRQLMMAYIDGTYGTFIVANQRNIWTNTTQSYGSPSAYYGNISLGTIDADSKTHNGYFIYCVRSQ